MTIRTRIGTSDLNIAPFTLGGNVFGWTANRAESFTVLDACIDGGANFVDTADGYSHWVPGNSGGESETIIGEWIAHRGRRDDVVIATKVSTHPKFTGLAAPNIHAAADASLERLQTETIDLYYAHYDDPETPLEETVEAFSRLVDAGKVRAIGMSNFTAARVTQWCNIARDGGFHLPVALQPQYSLVERGYESNGLSSVAEAEQLGVFPYYSLASGFLAGKYRTAEDLTAPGASPRAQGIGKYFDARGLQVLATLAQIAESRGAEVATVALAWLRQQPTITAPIASGRAVEQLPALLASMSLQLTITELDALKTASTPA